ncbi:hypothetical protein DHW03_15190 [Pedobacter yonginense]|uniref:HTH araC/xylS-type domain-containing protein n=1 Tax=Pedobacter yonginense TaxID=651869 RepID=A0A317EM73_9SPHI|nr:helix-turn-helix domain-containing protein [Pedobacter yonginense]PWS26138.1 hypothetical protein DHW03_15190 [Pedobacter yonginense]
MNHQIIQPPEILKRYVRFFWTIDQKSVSNLESTLKIFACRYPRMVFQHDNGNSAIKNNDSTMPNAFLSGINIKPYTAIMSSSFTLTGVSFYPYAIKPLFGIDMHELCDEFPDLQNFMEPELCMQILEKSTHTEKIDLLINFLCKRLIKLFKGNPLDHKIFDLPDIQHQDTSVFYLRKSLKISERQLERRFKHMVGLSPKQYLRVSRFEQAFALIQQRVASKLGPLAYELNYVDQSHFIKDFKELSGFTPSELIKKNKILEDSSSIVFNSENS